MKFFTSFFIFSLCCLFTAFNVYGEKLSKTTCCEYFYKEKDCPNCTIFSSIVDELEREYAPNLTVRRYIIGDSKDDYNASLLDAFYNNFSYEKDRVVPVFFVGKGIIVGDQDEDFDGYRTRIDAVLEKQVGSKCPNPDSILYPDLGISLGLTMFLAFSIMLTTVSIHPVNLAVFARLLRALGFGEFSALPTTGAEMDELETESSKKEEEEITEEKDEPKEPKEKEETDSSQVVISASETEGETKSTDEDASVVSKTKKQVHEEEDDDENTLVGNSVFPISRGDYTRFLSVSTFLTVYTLLSFLLATAIVAIIIGIVDKQSKMSMFIVDKIACSFLLLTFVLYVIDVLTPKCVKIHFSAPLYLGSKLSHLSSSTKSVKDAIVTALLTFVVILPLTASSQLGYCFLVAGRSKFTYKATYAVFMGTVGQFLPLFILYFIVCFKPSFLEFFWNKLPERSPILSLIISSAAGIFAFIFILEGLAFNPV